jgi:proton-dependent oligopeptide transporter, POT family
VRAEHRRILGGIAVVLIPVIFFWSLYDQLNTTWVQQGGMLQPYAIPFGSLSYELNGETMQTVNALFILLFIPLFSYVIYPWLRRQTWNPSLLGRMAFGMFAIAVAFAYAAVLQHQAESAAQRGQSLSILWQLGQYALLTFAEVLVSTTGLEFAFRKAPPTMKSTIMSFWLLTTALGNFVTALITKFNTVHRPDGTSYRYLNATQEMVLYIGIILVAMFVFIPLARRFDRKYPDQLPSQPTPAPAD